MKNKRNRIISNRKCVVETNPIESQWICQNKEFPTPVEISSTKNPGKLPGQGISYTCNALSKQIPLKSMDLPKQGISNTCELFEDISRVSGLGPAHLGMQIRVFPPKLTLAYRSVIGRAIQ